MKRLQDYKPYVTWKSFFQELFGTVFCLWYLAKKFEKATSLSGQLSEYWLGLHGWPIQIGKRQSQDIFKWQIIIQLHEKMELAEVKVNKTSKVAVSVTLE